MRSVRDPGDHYMGVGTGGLPSANLNVRSGSIPCDNFTAIRQLEIGAERGSDKTWSNIPQLLPIGEEQAFSSRQKQLHHAR
jgi:hypothetical protein